MSIEDRSQLWIYVRRSEETRKCIESLGTQLIALDSMENVFSMVARALSASEHVLYVCGSEWHPPHLCFHQFAATIQWNLTNAGNTRQQLQVAHDAGVKVLSAAVEYTSEEINTSQGCVTCAILALTAAYAAGKYKM
jgi:hypothetical protein